MTAPSSGLFSAVVDGYETVLTPAALETMTPGQLRGLSADSAVQSNVGKMIYGNTWYYAASMDEADAADYRVGDRVTLRFATELNRNLTMTISRISDSEGGQKLVIFSCDEYLSEVTLLRRQNASIIHKSYSGIRVPTAALRVEDGTPGGVLPGGDAGRVQAGGSGLSGRRLLSGGSGQKRGRYGKHRLLPPARGRQRADHGFELYDGKVLEN